MNVSITLTCAANLTTSDVSVDGLRILSRPGNIKVPCIPGAHTVSWNLVGTPAGTAFTIEVDATGQPVIINGTLDASGKASGQQPFNV